MKPSIKRALIISSVIIGVIIIASLVYYLATPKLPSTQHSSETVIIDNYSKYTAQISSDSFGYLGNYLFTFIKEPSKKVYHAVVVDNSYSYDSTSWFSKFKIKLQDSDVEWDVKLQTLKDGEINGDIGIACIKGSSCLSLSSKTAPTIIQAQLPISTDDYIIGYRKGDLTTLSVVYYDKAGTGKEKALEKIRSLGYKPEDYTIEFHYGGH